MAALPSGAFEVAVEVGHIASRPARIDQRAAALLEPLRRLVPFQAGGIFLLDPQRAAHVPVVSRGYDEALLAYIGSPDSSEEVELLGLNRRAEALRLRDLPVPRERLPSWTEYLRPAGFREGLAVGLFASDGRHLGVLGLSTDTDRHPTESARDLIGVLAPTIADAVDPLRSAVHVASVVDDAVAGVVLTSGGTTVPLPGLDTHPLLESGSDAVTAAADRLGIGRVYSSFLCRYATDDAPAGHVRITMLACPRDSPQHAVAVLLVSPPGDLRGLTPRELEILGMIVEGWPNRRIAAALFIADRTVSAHLENILAKLEAPTRTLAAVRALRYGLYVPRTRSAQGHPE